MKIGVKSRSLDSDEIIEESSLPAIARRLSVDLEYIDGNIFESLSSPIPG
jgi:hypothetical protein